MKIVEQYHVEVGGIKITLDQEAAFDLTGQLMDATGMAKDLSEKLDDQEEIIEVKDQKIAELKQQLEKERIAMKLAIVKMGIEDILKKKDIRACKREG